jgi:hypothetical protein
MQIYAHVSSAIVIYYYYSASSARTMPISFSRRLELIAPWTCVFVRLAASERAEVTRRREGGEGPRGNPYTFLPGASINICTRASTYAPLENIYRRGRGYHDSSKHQNAESRKHLLRLSGAWRKLRNGPRGTFAAAELFLLSVLICADLRQVTFDCNANGYATVLRLARVTA